MKNSLARFLESLKHPPHNYKPSTLLFQELNLKKIKQDLDLENIGRQRGEKNDPPIDFETLDDIENRICILIESEKKKCHELFLVELNTFSRRLIDLQPEGYFPKIIAAAKDAVSEFSAKVHQGIDEIHQQKYRVEDAERELRDFCSKNAINRPARYPESLIWKWALIALLFLIEVFLNGNFLARGHEFGMIGGFIEAIGIAFINIGAGILIGKLIAPYAYHRNMLLKTASFFAIIIYIGAILLFNVFVAHYRDALGGDFTENAARLAIISIKTNLLDIKEFQSWIMIGVGFIFSVIAALDGLSMDDPYPGYGPLERNRVIVQKDYIEKKEELINNLRVIKDYAINAMQEAQRDLAKRRGEYLSILGGRSSLIKRFQTHLDYLEKCANDLLAAYRQANRINRSVPPPPHFSKLWTLEKPPIPTDLELPSHSTLESASAQTEQTLTQQVDKVHEAYDQAVTQYKQIAQL